MKKLSALLLAFAMMLTMLSVASADDVQVIRMWSNDQHGYILPWEEIPALSTLVERFSSYNAPGYGEFFGQTYSVPIRVTTYGIACNNQIFKENNLELPKTWAEMEEAARVITQNSRGRKYGYALATTTSTLRLLTAQASVMSTSIIRPAAMTSLLSPAS